MSAVILQVNHAVALKGDNLLAFPPSVIAQSLP